MARNAIYTITTMGKLKEDKNGWPDYGASRVVGFYSLKEDAVKCVEGNYGDIWETYYDYALIEKMEEGLYGVTNDRQFFQYDKSSGRYKKIKEPEFMAHFAGISIGSTTHRLDANAS